MRCKVDENVHPEVVQLLRTAGHDAMSVHEQHLTGCTDEQLLDVCAAEQRTLITLDLDFADTRRYLRASPGVIVLRLHRQSRGRVLATMQRLLVLLAREPLAGELWITDEHRVRMRDAGEP